MTNRCRVTCDILVQRSDIMFESRCGCVCSECAYKDQMGCKGCLNIDNPFWGVCPMKACCEDKKLNHCGLCDEFPCGLLNQFAYDEKQGDNGLRIVQCRNWCREEN